MKNYFFFLIPATALLLGACSTYEEVPATSGKNETVVGFHADIAPREQSRADINVDFETGLTGTWNGEDNLGVMANDFTRLLQFTFNPANNAFEGALSATKGDWAYRAFYPHNGNATVSGTTVTLPFKAQRTQKGNKYNSEFDIMAADAISCIGSEPGKNPDGTAVKFNLHRLTSVLALKLQGGDASEKVASIMLTAAKPIASEQLTFTIPSDPTAAYDPSAINPTLIAEGTSAMGAPISIDSKHMTVTYADGTTPSADYSETFFNVLPDDNYGDLTFSICTDKGNAASITINRSTPVIANWVYTVDRTVSFAKAAAPTVEWIGHDDPAARYELAESGNSADIRVSVPGGIKSMQVDITSSVLTTPMGEGQPSMLEMVNLAPSMDLTNPANADMATSLASLGFPTPAQLQNQQYVFFQIGGLIDMLAAISPADQTTTADFKFTVTDNAGQSEIITLKYVKTVVSPITFNNDADLWANTASFTLTNIPADATSVTVQYKKSTETVWQTATVSSDKTQATITPEWEEATTTTDWTTPNTVLPYQRIKAGTGVFANNTYDYMLTVDGTENTGQFTTATDQIIPDGDMENQNLPCFTQNGSASSTFWGSGNNAQTPKLCTPGTDGDNHYATLQSISKVVLAAGNLFTGTFEYSSSSIFGGTGSVNFGQKYTFDARPASLIVSYRAKIGPVDKNMLGGPLTADKKTQDKARIFVAIIDWNSQHKVSSTYYAVGGPGNGCVGGWDPEKTTNPGEGEIIGYGSLWLTESAETEWQNANIQIQWYDKTSKPTDGNYSLIISCSANAYGDYMNGCTSNFLHIDDIQWGY